MYCWNCGKEMSEDAKFCKHCGEKVLEEIITATEPKASKGKKVKMPKWVIGIAVTAVAAAAILGTTYSLGGFDYIGAAWETSAGDRYLDAMEYEKAIAAYEKAIEIEPKKVDAYIGLAKAYVAQGDYEAAIEILEEGIEETDSEELEDLLEEIQEEWNAKNIRIAGYIYKVDTDLINDNNEVIADAVMELTDKSGKTTSYEVDRRGYYETDTLEKGKYTVSYYADGYLSYEQEVDLTGGVYELDVYIEPDTYTALYGNISIADEDTNYGNNTPLSDAEIVLEKLNSSNRLVVNEVTDYNGQYVVEGLTMGVYEMAVYKNGYIETKQNVVIYEGQDTSYNVMIEVINEAYDGEGIASGTVYDALTGMGVEGLTLTIREGIGNMDGSVIETFTTSEYGYYYTPELESGNYCITIEDQRDLEDEEERYITTCINVKILGGMEIPYQDGTVSNVLSQGQLRIVLTWGEWPDDLDSHMVGELSSGESFHVFYNWQEAYIDDEVIVNLDLDDTSSYGPETTTIYKDLPGVYTFFVHNFSGYSEDELASSGACVQVYMDSSVVPSYVFYVPSGVGYYWNVFEYDTRTGILTPINEMEMYSEFYY